MEFTSSSVEKEGNSSDGGSFSTIIYALIFAVICAIGVLLFILFNKIKKWKKRQKLSRRYQIKQKQLQKQHELQIAKAQKKERKQKELAKKKELEDLEPDSFNAAGAAGGKNKKDKKSSQLNSKNTESYQLDSAPVSLDMQGVNLGKDVNQNVNHDVDQDVVQIGNEPTLPTEFDLQKTTSSTFSSTAKHVKKHIAAITANYKYQNNNGKNNNDKEGKGTVRVVSVHSSILRPPSQDRYSETKDDSDSDVRDLYDEANVHGRTKGITDADQYGPPVNLK